MNNLRTNFKSAKKTNFKSDVVYPSKNSQKFYFWSIFFYGFLCKPNLDVWVYRCATTYKSNIQNQKSRKRWRVFIMGGDLFFTFLFTVSSSWCYILKGVKLNCRLSLLKQWCLKQLIIKINFILHNSWMNTQCVSQNIKMQYSDLWFNEFGIENVIL